jgi:hypothetical protein
MSAERFLVDFPSEKRDRAVLWLTDPKNEVPIEWDAPLVDDREGWKTLQDVLEEVLGISIGDILGYIGQAYQEASIPISRDLTSDRKGQLAASIWELMYPRLQVSWKDHTRTWTEFALYAYIPRAVYILERRRTSHQASPRKRRRFSPIYTSPRQGLAIDISIYLVDRRIEVYEDSEHLQKRRLAELTVGSLLPKENTKLLCQYPIDLRNHHLSWDRFLSLVSIQGGAIDNSSEMSYYINSKKGYIQDEFQLRNAIGLLHLELGTSTDPIVLLLKRQELGVRGEDEGL